MIVKRWFIGILKFIWHHTYIKYRNWHSVEKEKRQWVEKRVRYGKENPDKTFYVIRRREIRAGLFSYFLQNVNDIKYALDRGWIPVVDLQNSLNMYLNEDQIGRVNAWEYFFEQPCGYSLKDIKKSKNIVLGSGYLKECFPYKDISYLTDLEGPISEYREIVKKYCRPSSEAQCMIDEVCNRLGIDDKTIGVLCRGTDYTTIKPRGHHIQPAPEDMFDELDELIKTKGCDKIFLGTEDKEIYKRFEERYPDKIVTNRDDFVEYNGENSLGQKTKDSNKDLKNEGLVYLTTIAVLAKCKYFIGGATSGTVGVMLMANGFDYCHVYDLGLYP